MRSLCLEVCSGRGKGVREGGAALSQVRQPMSFRFFILVSIFQVCWLREEVWLARTVPGD